VITSPGDSDCRALPPDRSCLGSATRAPSAFLRPRLSAIVQSDGWNLVHESSPRLGPRPLVLELGDHSLHGRGRDENAMPRYRRTASKSVVDAHTSASVVEGRGTGLPLCTRRVVLDAIVGTGRLPNVSRTRAETMPAVTVTPRPNVITDRRGTQSPMRGLASESLAKREKFGAPSNLDQRDVGALRRCRSLSRCSLASSGVTSTLSALCDPCLFGTE